MKKHGGRGAYVYFQHEVQDVAYASVYVVKVVFDVFKDVQCICLFDVMNFHPLSSSPISHYPAHCIFGSKVSSNSR